MIPISLKDITKAVNGVISDEKYNDICVSNITIDTRKINEKDFFIPIKGNNFDGHSFIDSAFKKGAICVLSADKYRKYDKPVIYVDDTREALKDFAQYYISLFNIPVIAITGSVGKTTTKDIIASVLSQKYNVVKTEGNFNNEIGLPLTIFNINYETEVVVLEMGMNNFGEIHNLSKIAKPNIAVITNIGVSHIENLGSREGILKAKCEIFDYMNKNDKAVLNIDDDLLSTIENKYTFDIFWYGIKNKGNIYADNILKNGVNSISCDIFINNDSFNVNIPVPGEHMVLNAMSATIVGDILGLSLLQIKKGIEEFVPSKMRMSVIKTKNNTTIINDVYNANPISMKSAIDVICEAEEKKICILGDMFELGEFANDMHYEIGYYISKKNIDKVICIGDLSKNIYEAILLNKSIDVFYYNTKEQFIKNDLDNIIDIGSIILVKASRGMQFEEIVEKIKEVK